MSVGPLHYIALLVAALAFCQSASAADNICRIEGDGVAFSKETRIIPYRRVYSDSAWSANEEDGDQKHRYPITGMTGSTGNFGSAGLHVEGYESDYFPVELVRTPDNAKFLIKRMVWPAKVYRDRNEYLAKYSAQDVSYYLSLINNETCDEKLDLSVLVYKNGKQVETILFHVKDMSNAKDFWPEERKNPGDGR